MKPYQLFSKFFKQKQLLKVYNEKIIQTGSIGIDKVNHSIFQNSLDNNIEIINRKVMNNTYKFIVYKEKLISKGAEKVPRVISVPSLRDRLTLRTLCNILFKIYENEIHLNIPQVTISNIQSLIQERKYNAYIKIDIQTFYDSIEHDILIKKLKKKIHKKELITLIDKAIKNGTVNSPKKGEKYFNKKGVPQGLSISNILAEIYMLDFDNKIRLEENISYFRYVDDILILCNFDDSQNIGNKIINELENICLTAHPLGENSKSQIGLLSTNDFYFLGYYFLNYHTSVGMKTVQRFESSIVRLLTTYKYRERFVKNHEEKTRNLKILEWRLNLRITGCIFDNTKRGWIFYYSQITDIKTLYEIDNTIKNLLKRFGVFGDIHLKKLAKAFFETKKIIVSSNNYIINFDNLNKDEKIDILQKYLGEKYNLNRKSTEEIDRLFKLRINKAIKELEEDLQDFS